MKITFYIALLSFLFSFYSNDISAVVDVYPEVTDKLASKNEVKNAVKHLSLEKQKRLKKRLERIKRKVERKSAGSTGFLDDSKFRLGAVVFAAGLILLLFASLFFGFGLIGWVGNLAVLVGLILMIWAFIQYI